MVGLIAAFSVDSHLEHPRLLRTIQLLGGVPSYAPNGERPSITLAFPAPSAGHPASGRLAQFGAEHFVATPLATPSSPMRPTSPWAVMV